MDCYIITIYTRCCNSGLCSRTAVAIESITRHLSDLAAVDAVESVWTLLILLLILISGTEGRADDHIITALVTLVLLVTLVRPLKVLPPTVRSGGGLVNAVALRATGNHGQSEQQIASESILWR